MNTFMDKIRSIFGLRPEPPRNDFRNPIWGSDDDDDEDELYSRQQVEIYQDPLQLQQEFAIQMQEMFKTFGSIFGDMKSFFDENSFETFQSIPDNHHTFDSQSQTEDADSNRIRDFYLKPGYHLKHHPKEDIDLDGKISTNDISDLFKKKPENHVVPTTPFNGNMVPGRSFCQTIITTSVSKPDGTIETKRIVKNGNEVIEETISSTEPTSKSPYPGFNPIDTTNIMFTQLSSLLKNFY